MIGHLPVRTNADVKADTPPAITRFETKQARQERRARDLIAREKQRELNRKEWVRRAKDAWIRGDHKVASHIITHVFKNGDD